MMTEEGVFTYLHRLSRFSNMVDDI